MNREQLPLPSDLKVFLTVARKTSFVAAADELGQSPAYISKRIRILETVLKTKLFHRTTRCVVLTDDGETTRIWATQILNDIDDLVDELSWASKSPRGLLHICSTFGFGRAHVAPALSVFSEHFDQLEVRLDLFDRTVDIVREGFDLEIRIGDDLPEQHICKKLVTNRRILCASPKYLETMGVPETPEDLAQHNCLVIKERASSFGTWELEGSDGKVFKAKIGGRLSTNHGEVALQWTLNGRGITLRSLWDAQLFLHQGRLVQVLPDFSQSANVWAVYPTRPSQSFKLRVCVEFLQRHFAGMDCTG